MSLFNKNLPLEERNSLAAKVGSLPATDVPIGNPKLPQMSGSSKLTELTSLGLVQCSFLT